MPPTEELVDLGRPIYFCEHCGARFRYAEREDKSRHSLNPKFTLCCNDGRIKLPLLEEPPIMLKKLMDYAGGPLSNRFRKKIRPLNSKHCLTSFGADIDLSVNVGGGSYTFKVNGQCSHRLGSLLSVPGQKPRFAQLYVFDTDNEVQNRLNSIDMPREPDALDKQIAEGLIKMFDEHNKLVKAFRMAKDSFQGDSVPDFRLKLLAGGGLGDHQYAGPQIGETVGLIVGDDSEMANGMDVIVQHRNGQLQRVDSSFP